MEGKGQKAAAAASGMSERTARRWSDGPLPSETVGTRSWRTREDPFAGVWESEIVPLLESDRRGVLRANTLLEELMASHPDRFTAGQLRTLQRRLRDWRALHGPEREVYFEQEHRPGREAAVDFTRGKSLGVTIRGELLEHLIFELVLSFSGWTWVKVVFGETYEALVSCVQGAFWDLGGVTECLRSDNLSAATHELKRSRGRGLTARFEKVLEHYGLRSTRIEPGESHQNGVVERSHRTLKSWIAQALVLRGSPDFSSLEEYEGFLCDLVSRRRNGPAASKLAEERLHLKPLPSCRIPCYTVIRTTVRKWSTIRVSGRTYSVPSRLIGHEVKVLQHENEIEVRYKDRVVERIPRLRGESEHRINYRHVIRSLSRKPGAFGHYRYREELFPNLVFRRAYDRLRRDRGDRADVEYVRILDLAASTMECQVSDALEQLMASSARLDYASVKKIANPEEVVIPALPEFHPELCRYDSLLEGAWQ